MQKIKRFLSITIAMVLLLSTLSIQSFATGNADFTVSNGVLKRYTGSDTAVNIPGDMGTGISVYNKVVIYYFVLGVNL